MINGYIIARYWNRREVYICVWKNVYTFTYFLTLSFDVAKKQWPRIAQNSVQILASICKLLLKGVRDSSWNADSRTKSSRSMVIHSNIAWKTPWTEEPGGFQSIGSQRVRHGWTTDTNIVVERQLTYVKGMAEL